jgi:hypothetical protein
VIKWILIEEGFEHDPTLGMRLEGDEEKELHWSDLVDVRVVQRFNKPSDASSSSDKESLAQLKQNWLSMLNP